MLEHFKDLVREQRGASMVEFAIIASLLFMVTGGIIDFSLAFYQWNNAVKAAQVGARLAAVSDPVSSDLKTLTGLEGGALPGDPFPAFSRVCNGASSSCSGGTYDLAAMRTLIYGRGQTTCGTLGADGYPGMCDVYSRIAPANVIVTYTQSGLGFAGRPGGAVPTIKVQLTGINYSLVFIPIMIGSATMPMPPISTTVTGEDMRTTN